MSLKYSNLCQLTDTLICAKCREHAVHISSHYTTDWPVQDIPSKFYVTRNHRWEIGLYLTYITAEYQGRSDGGISGYIPPKSAQVNFLRGKNDVKTGIQQFYTPQKKHTPKTNFWLRPCRIRYQQQQWLHAGHILTTFSQKQILRNKTQTENSTPKSSTVSACSK